MSFSMRIARGKRPKQALYACLGPSFDRSAIET
jgi:hypothetical protein